jgi:hypothetical protein
MTALYRNDQARRTRPVLVCREPAAGHRAPAAEGRRHGGCGDPRRGVHRPLGRADAGAGGAPRRGARCPSRGLRRVGAQWRAGEPRLQQVPAGARGETGRGAAPARSGTLPRTRGGSCATSARPTRPRPPTAPDRPSPNTPRAVAELEAEAAFLDKRYGFAVEVMDRAGSPTGEIAALRRWCARPGRRASAPAGLCPGAGPRGRGGGRRHPRSSAR